MTHDDDFAAKKITISPLISGDTTELTCFPLNNLVILERGDVAKLAGKALSRRTHFIWDDFDQFKNDVQNICFVEKIVDASPSSPPSCPPSCPPSPPAWAWAWQRAEGGGGGLSPKGRPKGGYTKLITDVANYNIGLLA